MDDGVLIALGRQFLEFCLQKEELLRTAIEARAKVKELEEAAATKAPPEG